MHNYTLEESSVNSYFRWMSVIIQYSDEEKSVLINKDESGVHNIHLKCKRSHATLLASRDLPSSAKQSKLTLSIGDIRLGLRQALTHGQRFAGTVDQLRAALGQFRLPVHCMLKLLQLIPKVGDGEEAGAEGEIEALW